MTDDLKDRAKSFVQKHPIITALGLAGAAAVGVYQVTKKKPEDDPK